MPRRLVEIFTDVSGNHTAYLHVEAARENRFLVFQTAQIIKKFPNLMIFITVTTQALNGLYSKPIKYFQI